LRHSFCHLPAVILLLTLTGVCWHLFLAAFAIIPLTLILRLAIFAFCSGAYFCTDSSSIYYCSIGDWDRCSGSELVDFPFSREWCTFPLTVICFSPGSHKYHPVFFALPVSSSGASFSIVNEPGPGQHALIPLSWYHIGAWTTLWVLHGFICAFCRGVRRYNLYFLGATPAVLASNCFSWTGHLLAHLALVSWFNFSFTKFLI